MESKSLQNDKYPELRGVCATLQPDSSILLAGNKLWLTPSSDEDKAFILSTWIRSYLPIARKIEHVYKTHQCKVDEDAVLEHVKSAAESNWKRAAVLRDDEDGSAILGYVVGDYASLVLHYAYVIPELRNCGIFKAMVSAQFDGHPTLTHFWPFRWRGGWKYNPYKV